MKKFLRKILSFFHKKKRPLSAKDNDLKYFKDSSKSDAMINDTPTEEEIKNIVHPTPTKPSTDNDLEYFKDCSQFDAMINDTPTEEEIKNIVRPTPTKPSTDIPSNKKNKST